MTHPGDGWHRSGASFRRMAGPLVLLALLGGTSCRAQQAPSPPAAGSLAKPAHTNHLAGETSPYLLQHAHNPVDWYPWGPEAFAKARQEGKPIFLSIGYSSCHWCHVMEAESFEDEGIAQLLNEHFVAIKVDREERPDLDEAYMTAVQLMTGSGGWPMSTFLTPDGKPFVGGTYFPRDHFAELLRKVDGAWKDPDQRKQIAELAGRVAAAMEKASARVPEPGTAAPGSVTAAVHQYLEDLDAKNGGFGGAPKFPPALRLSLMLAEQRRKPDARLLGAATLTLEHMARGGMYDQVGGGFHRYSTDAKWLVPHFEKMLYDQALLAQVYLEGYRETKNPLFRRVATETLDMVLRDLRDPSGGFRSTLDADSPGPDGKKEEGRFYTWTPGEVAAVLGKADADFFGRLYDITSTGNFEQRCIPNLLSHSPAARAKELKTTETALWGRLDPLREKLRRARERRPHPALDDKVLTSWNGLMIRSLALAYDVTGEERYREAAEKAAAFLLANRSGDRLRHSHRAGKSRPEAFLEDYSFLAAGLLELHRATGDPRWLREAQGLTRTMVADFWDEKAGIFYSTPASRETISGTLALRTASAEDSSTPSATSMAALVLSQLASSGDGPELKAKARRVLDTFSTPMKRFPATMPGMLLAADTFFHPEARKSGDAVVTLSVVGSPTEVHAGKPFPVVVRMTIRPGWHVNAHTPAEASLVATRIEPAEGPFRLVSASYPDPQTVRLGFSKTPLKVYAGTVDVHLTLAPAPGPAPGSLRLRVKYQPCNDRVCDAPVDALLVVPIAPAP